MWKRNTSENSRGKIEERSKLNRESENNVNSQEFTFSQEKKWWRNCKMLLNSVLNDAVSTGHTDLHCSSTAGTLLGHSIHPGGCSEEGWCTCPSVYPHGTAGLYAKGSN